MRSIPLIKPVITEDLKRRVCEVLDSGYLTEGPVTRDFERAVGGYVGAAHCLAVTSCTTGLELALRALSLGPGDEVIVPDYTYPATADAVCILGATAVIVDVDPETMLVDYEALEAAVTPRTKALLPVSLFGNPLDAGRLAAIAERHELKVVEDAACSLGAEMGGRKVGTLADITAFSHHPRKFITTGEGGTVTTDDPDLAAWMESYKHFGMGTVASREGTVFARIGTNYKLSNVLAAIGLAQMGSIHELLAERRNLAARYLELLRGRPGIGLPRTTPGGLHSWQTFSVFVEQRDRVMAGLRGQGIEVQIGTYSLHMHPAFQDNPLCRIEGDMSGSRLAFERTLALPLFHGMTAGDQEYVVERLSAEVGK